jgi:hypothetical protein
MEPFGDLTRDINHSTTNKFGKYFEFISLVQREIPHVIIHIFLPAMEHAKERVSFIPLLHLYLQWISMMEDGIPQGTYVLPIKTKSIPSIYFQQRL